MFKIPNESKRWKIANTTDLFGNIFATKNINFDSEGVAKLSEATVAVKSENGDTEFDTPIGFGRYSGGSGILSTIDRAYILDMDLTYSISMDTSSNTPTGGTNSHAVWWQDAWYQTQSTSLVRATSTFPTWSTSLATLTSGVGHSLCVFKNRNKMVIGNGSSVMQIDSSHSTSGISQLTIPSELEVTSIAYNNNRIIVGTKNKASNSGSGGIEAFVFIWDGVTTGANIGIPVGTDIVLAVSAYQESSFVVLTGTGQLLRFNGSGFDTLASLPFYFTDRNWTDYFPNYITRNGIIQTEGDVIYINIPNTLQISYDDSTQFIPNFAGGIYCWDKNVGLYHRYSPSISLVSSSSVSSTDSATGVLTSVADVPNTGTPIRLTTNVNAGIIEDKLYYIIKTGTKTFKIANTYTESLAGTSVTFTGASVTTGTVNFYNIKDFGSYTSRLTGMVNVLKESSHGMYGHLIWGEELFNPTTNATNTYATLNINVPDIENRGYLVTSRLESQDVNDIFKKLYIKFQPLKQDIDKIVIKYRTNKNNNLPISTPKSDGSTDSSALTWTDSDTFTTVCNLTNATVGDEVEILAGNGAGQTSHISSLTYNTGTWTVNLDEPLKYITASEKAHFMIDNWKRLDTGTIDNTNTEGMKEVSLGIQSKWIQFKVELRGVGVVVEELQIINGKQQPSV